MSYIHMDHAAWVQSNIGASKPRLTKSEIRKGEETNRGWGAAPEKLNAFQCRAFNILGIVGGGIYNAPISWKTVYWKPETLIVSWFRGMATFDFNQLTCFVFLCHEARIRGEISPLAPQYLEIMLTERRAEGPIHARHPNLEEAVETWREIFPVLHPISYRSLFPPETT